MGLLRRLWTSEEGQDLAEYAILFGLIVLAVVGFVALIGVQLHNSYSSIAGKTNW